VASPAPGEEAEDGSVELVGHLEMGQVTAMGQDQAPRTRDACLDRATVGVHVSDIVLTRDDQRGDRYLAQAREHGRLKRPFEVFSWP
jgi:hypothetical protein